MWLWVVSGVLPAVVGWYNVVVVPGIASGRGDGALAHFIGSFVVGMMVHAAVLVGAAVVGKTRAWVIGVNGVVSIVVWAGTAVVTEVLRGG